MANSVQGPVVRKPIDTNPRLTILPRSLFLFSQLLFNAVIRQNVTLKRAILKNKNKQKKFSPKSWKRESKVYANPGLS